MLVCDSIMSYFLMFRPQKKLKFHLSFSLMQEHRTRFIISVPLTGAPIGQSHKHMAIWHKQRLPDLPY